MSREDSNQQYDCLPTANGTFESQLYEKMLHLKSAQLSGYKSIKQAEVSFKPGLNIIIGKNAVGKTNLLNFLFQLLRFDYDNLFENFSGDLEFEGNTTFEVTAIRQGVGRQSESSNAFSLKPVEKTFLIDGTEHRFSTEDDGITGWAENVRDYLDFDGILVRHGIPFAPLFFDKPYSFDIGAGNVVFQHVKDSKIFFFQKVLVASLFRIYQSENRSIEQLESEVRDKIAAELSKVTPSISVISDVSDIRLSEDFRVAFGEDERPVASNIYFEYRIDRAWRAFSQLSSGTQRLILLISDLVIGGEYSFTQNSIIHNFDQESSRILLIEEPELGIHPHQLQKLMQLIKEQSEKKQIILTTHSPQVLDILEADELDRIVIAKHDRIKGTTFHHLTDAQIKKAKSYMKEVGFLSDYWRFSDLED